MDQIIFQNYIGLMFVCTKRIQKSTHMINWSIAFRARSLQMRLINLLSAEKTKLQVEYFTKTQGLLFFLSLTSEIKKKKKKKQRKNAFLFTFFFVKVKVFVKYAAQNTFESKCPIFGVVMSQNFLKFILIVQQVVLRYIVD